MEEKKYLKWYNKVGYGSGDIAGNVVYAFLTSFVMIYLTETVGLASGIVGTLIAFSKLLDGFTDVSTRHTASLGKHVRGCCMDISVAQSRWLHALRYRQALARQHSIRGSFWHTHC